MPIHVQHGNGKGHFLFLKLVQKRRVALLGVLPVAAPPVAKGVARHHGRRTRQAVEIADRPHVVVLIAEEIHVAVPRSARLQPALLVKEKRFAIIKEASSAGILQAELQGVGTVDLVKGTGGSQEVVMSWRIAVGCGTVLPASAVVGVAVLGINVEIFGSKFLFVVDQMEGDRGDLQASFLVHNVKFGGVKGSVQHHLRGAILKDAALTVFQAKQIGGKHRKAVMLSLHHARRIAFSVSQIMGLLTVKAFHSFTTFPLSKGVLFFQVSLYHKEKKKSIKNRPKKAKKI